MNRPLLVAHARGAIARGSRSFAAASRLFDRRTRERVWLLYAWCRRCDDLADAQDHGGPLGDQAGAPARLAAIRDLTARALAGEPTGDPSFDALGAVARETGLTPQMADDVIAGFALDAAGWRPDSEAQLMRYCYHVAGAVGVMMAVVMGVSPQDEEVLDRACDLGLAFQLANIARDLREDHAAGRCYMPRDWLAQAGIAPDAIMAPANRPALVALVAKVVAMAKAHEAQARAGAHRLAFRQRWAVLSAAGIYGAIADRVARAGANAWDDRVRTGGGEKLGCVIRGLRDALLAPFPPHAAPRWSRRELAAIARG